MMNWLICMFFGHSPVGFALQPGEIRPAGHVDVWCKRCHVGLPGVSIDAVEQWKGLE